MKKLGVGFVDTGLIVDAHHVKAWRWIRNADITAVCDVKEERAKSTAALCEELGVGKPKVYTDVSEMIQTRR